MAASTLCPTLAQESVRLLRRRGVETVILAGADVHGIMRGKRVPIAELDRAAERGIALSDVIWALPVDEVEPVQPPAGHDGWFPRPGYPDMLAMPDLETARIVPWHDRTALLLCDFLDRDGRAIPLSPRAVLRSVVERARALGVEPIVGIELEFYALRETPQSVLAKRPSQLEAVQERPSVYGVVAASRHEDFAGAVRSTLQEYGLAVEACAPEAGPGQFEINVRAAPALRAADEAFLLKSAVKEIAAPPRAAGDVHGQAALRLAGQLVPPASQPARRHARRDAPLPRRAAGGDGRADRDLRPHAELLPAPDPVLVGGHDRHVERRQPLRRRPGDLRRRRHRPGRASPGRRRRQPVPRRRGGARRGARRGAARVRAAAARRRRRLRAAPTAPCRRFRATLGAATDLLERSALARDWLGDDVVDHCVAMRRAELAAQSAAVTDWETARYLEAL